MTSENFNPESIQALKQPLRDRSKPKDHFVVVYDKDDCDIVGGDRTTAMFLRYLLDVGEAFADEDNENWFFRSNKEILGALGISEKKLNAMKAHLEKLGFIEFKRDQTHYVKNFYRVNFVGVYAALVELRPMDTKKKGKKGRDTQSDTTSPQPTSTEQEIAAEETVNGGVDPNEQSSYDRKLKILTDPFPGNYNIRKSIEAVSEEDLHEVVALCKQEGRTGNIAVGSICNQIKDRANRESPVQQISTNGSSNPVSTPWIDLIAIEIPITFNEKMTNASPAEDVLYWLYRKNDKNPIPKKIVDNIGLLNGYMVDRMWDTTEKAERSIFVNKVLGRVEQILKEKEEKEDIERERLAAIEKARLAQESPDQEPYQVKISPSEEKQLVAA